MNQEGVLLYIVITFSIEPWVKLIGSTRVYTGAT